MGRVLSRKRVGREGRGWVEKEGVGREGRWWVEKEEGG